ncbi:phosphate signaling complex protein PhoU [Brevibacillus migulae]|uniref:phosphate signaling complex protein PhoU n=1 Tax=Brevibacillus migulae TaxID=1644114 RepID=UPI00106E418B|nr:phosphate signaling complex protein PhoU [Brevibacillus migulae]
METRSNFHLSLEQLHTDLLRMGHRVEEQIHRGVDSLAKLDMMLAKETIQLDDEIDDMLIAIEDHCVRLIALQQPIARDLRLISMAMKIVTDLERIGDHGVDIAKITLQLTGETLVKPLVDIPKMASKAIEMLHQALKAYIDQDVSLAEQLAPMDDEVDKLYSDIFEEVTSLMGTDRATNRQLSHLLMVARYLERIADHATNIGEWVIYVVTGERKDLNV